jgi:hypothetical protein
MMRELEYGVLKSGHPFDMPKILVRHNSIYRISEVGHCSLFHVVSFFDLGSFFNNLVCGFIV